MSVKLRPLANDDGERVLAWRNSSEVARHMYSDHVISATEHQAWLARSVGAADRQVWIIVWRGAPVGLAALNRAEADARRWDWAFYLADSSVRGQGVGACVEYLVLRHAFETLHARKLWCEVLLRNEPVWRLHLSFGFTREADLRDHVFKDGDFQDVVGLGILDRDWARQKPLIEQRLAPKGLLDGASVVSNGSFKAPRAP